MTRAPRRKIKADAQTAGYFKISGPKRIVIAMRKYKTLRKEIAPFIKRRNVEGYSTAGRWCDTSSLAEHEALDMNPRSQ